MCRSGLSNVLLNPIWRLILNLSFAILVFCVQLVTVFINKLLLF